MIGLGKQHKLSIHTPPLTLILWRPCYSSSIYNLQMTQVGMQVLMLLGSVRSAYSPGFCPVNGTCVFASLPCSASSTITRRRQVHAYLPSIGNWGHPGLEMLEPIGYRCNQKAKRNVELRIVNCYVDSFLYVSYKHFRHARDL